MGVTIGMHSSRGLGERNMHKIYEPLLRVEAECLLDEGTEWVVGRLTWTAWLSLLQLNESESMDAWAAALSTR